jgi:hypothetical protein
MALVACPAAGGHGGWPPGVRRSRQPAVHCRPGAFDKGREDKEWLRQTGLGGEGRDLFPKTYNPYGSAPAIVLKKSETYRASEHLSDYASAFLGLPRRGGLDVACTLRMSISTTERPARVISRESVKFSFEWACPDEAGLKAIQDRLKQMLQGPVAELHQYYLLDCLLRTEEVAESVSRDELLAALDRRNHRYEGRVYIAAALIKRHDAAKEVLAYYEGRLRAKPFSVLEDIEDPRFALWSPSFISPLVDLYGGPYVQVDGRVVRLLHRYRDDWLRNKDEVRRLMALVRKHHPVLDKELKQLADKDLEPWAMAAGQLGLVADDSAVALLRPALDDRRVWYRPAPRSVASAPPPFIRMCDTAWESITRILDGKLPAPPLLESWKIGWEHKERTEAAFVAERDAMIQRLKERLAAGDRADK